MGADLVQPKAKCHNGGTTQQKRNIMSIQYTFKEKPKLDHTVVQEIDETMFYNLMQDVAISKLLIDVRERPEYDHSHAKAAINLHLTSAIQKHMLDFVRDYNTARVNQEKNAHHDAVASFLNENCPEFARNAQFRLRGLLFKSVVLYGEETHEQPTTTTPAELTNDHVCLDLLAEILRIENKVERVYIMRHYDRFEQKYPFLCSTRETGVAFNQSYPTEVVDNFLYLGDRGHASTRKILDDLNIRYVLNMAEELENSFEMDPEFFYEKLGVGDTLNDNIRPTFERAIAFIQKAKQEGKGSVLVHCNMGVSRSTTALVSYLMTEWNCSFDTAFEHVKLRRSFVNPNSTFCLQLNEFYSHSMMQQQQPNQQATVSVEQQVTTQRILLEEDQTMELPGTSAAIEPEIALGELSLGEPQPQQHVHKLTITETTSKTTTIVKTDATNDTTTTTTTNETATTTQTTTTTNTSTEDAPNSSLGSITPQPLIPTIEILEDHDILHPTGDDMIDPKQAYTIESTTTETK